MSQHPIDPIDHLLAAVAHLAPADAAEVIAEWSKYATQAQLQRLVAAGLLGEGNSSRSGGEATRSRVGLLGEAAGGDDPLPREEHVTTTKQLPGGPIEVRCSCAKWSGVAPSYEAAEFSAAQHRAAQR